MWSVESKGTYGSQRMTFVDVVDGPRKKPESFTKGPCVRLTFTFRQSRGSPSRVGQRLTLTPDYEIEGVWSSPYSTSGQKRLSL